MMQDRDPSWTVLYNIVSPESPRWIGTGWEFFGTEEEAQTAYFRLGREKGRYPTKRPFYAKVDRSHLGAAHR